MTSGPRAANAGSAREALAFSVGACALRHGEELRRRGFALRHCGTHRRIERIVAESEDRAAIPQDFSSLGVSHHSDRRAVERVP